MVCLGSASHQTILVPLRLNGSLEVGKIYHTQVYNSERTTWVEGETSRAEAFTELAVEIEEGGYRLLRFLETPDLLRS